MAYLRDRRAFGNIGTRKFRGARFGDPLSPRGPQYTKEGLILDYSTDVGPFTIIDQSGQDNTATLYSGRGLTMDAVGDTVTYATGYSSASRTATLWGRFNTTSPVALLGSVSGFFIFTPTATGVWEELTSTATVEGDLAWDLGLDFDIGDLRVGTEHWTHNDWSNPTGNTSNGKTIVDSGPNGYHGVCTGCSGFTGEATIPQTADRNWNKYDWNGGTPILSATGTMLVSASDANDQIDALGNAILEPRRNTQQLNLFGEGEYSRTPDSDSLDVTTEATWELWGNFYGTVNADEIIFSKYEVIGNNRSWAILKPPSGSGAGIDKVALNLGTATGTFGGQRYWAGLPDSIGQLLITFNGGTLEAFWNGVSLGAGALSTGTIPPIIYAGTAIATIGAFSSGSNPSAKKLGSAKIYNRALTADEVLTNYNTQKSLYLNVFPFTLT
jgi:hypothetical protein